MDIVNNYLSENYEITNGGLLSFSGEPYIMNRPRMVCKDGFNISIQAS